MTVERGVSAHGTPGGRLRGALDPPILPPFDATMRTPLLAALGLSLVACKGSPPAPTGAGPDPSGTSTTSAATKPAAAPLAKPEKLDVPALKAAFKCGKASPAGPCAILEEFKECVPTNPVTRSGDGRWMGKAYVVKDGAFIEEIALLRSKAVPAGQVGEGALPAKIAIDAIPDDRGGEKSNAERAINAYERGDVPLPQNTAVRYVKERTEWSDAPVMAAEGEQLYVASGSGAYLCGRSNQRLILVRRSPSRSHAGDGTYAVLWPVSW